MRYTECRLHNLTSAALLMDLESDTIEFAPNFDGSQVLSFRILSVEGQMGRGGGAQGDLEALFPRSARDPKPPAPCPASIRWSQRCCLRGSPTSW